MAIDIINQEDNSINANLGLSSSESLGNSDNVVDSSFNLDEYFLKLDMHISKIEAATSNISAKCSDISSAMLKLVDNISTLCGSYL